MSTCSDIVRRALRALNVLGAGQEPSGHDAEDGLEALQSCILDIPGLLHNSRWTEVAVDDDYEACEGDRITVTGTPTITFPSTVTDLYTNESRPPKDLAKVYVIGGPDATAGLWLYSATNGEWRLATGLTIDDDVPFGAEDDAGLAAYLAVSMMDEYGAAVSDRTAIRANVFVRDARARLKKAEPLDYRRLGNELWSGDYV